MRMTRGRYVCRRFASYRDAPVSAWELGASAYYSKIRPDSRDGASGNVVTHGTVGIPLCPYSEASGEFTRYAPYLWQYFAYLPNSVSCTPAPPHPTPHPHNFIGCTGAHHKGAPHSLNCGAISEFAFASLRTSALPP